MTLVEPWAISSLIYCLPAMIGYLLLWMFVRGTTYSGQINFKSEKEAVVFILGGIVLALLIFTLSAYGVLPQ